MKVRFLPRYAILLIVLFFFTLNSLEAQCLEGLTVTTRNGDTELNRCPVRIGNPDIVRVTTGNPPVPVGYLLTDEDNNIIRVSSSSNFNLTDLGVGTFRIWGFTYAGTIQASPGENAEETSLGSICGRLTENFVTLRNFNEDECFSIQILHNNNGESQIINGGEGLEHIGGVARVKRKLDGLRSVAFLNDWYSILLSSGDHYVESPEFSANLSLGPDEPFYDAIALQRFGYDAIGIGNHDFDFGPDIFARFINDFGTENVPPFVSANLDFSGEPALQELVDANRIRSSKIVFRGEEPMGVIGITTPQLAEVSNSGNVTANSALVEIIQAEVNAFLEQGINKIILISHLDALEKELGLAEDLRDIDIIIAGGGESLLTNDPSVALEGDEVDGPYPLRVSDRDGEEVLVVTTPGKYRYIGQLAVTFDPLGEVNFIDNSSGPVLVDSEEENAEILELVTNPVRAFIENLGGNLAAPLGNALDEAEFAGFQINAFPNPVEDVATVQYRVASNSEIGISLYNTFGQQVANLFDGFQNGGYYSLTIEMDHLASGNYFLRIRHADQVETLTIVKQ